MATRTKPTPPASNSIHRDEILTLTEAGRRLNLRGDAMRVAQKRGLRTIKFARAKYIRGADVHRFFDGLAAEADAAEVDAATAQV